MGFGSLKALKTDVESKGTSAPTIKTNGDGPEEMKHPRWVRINTLHSTLKEQLANAFSSFKRMDDLLDVMRAAASDEVLYVDDHIPQLIALPPNFDLAKSDGYQSGALIMQDKASCFPAYLLDPQSIRGDVVDACAAPGNKTTHLAALMRGKKTRRISPRAVFAYERDKGRSQTLKKMTAAADATDLVTVHNQDFLTVDPQSEDMQRVTALLLDPSCSGSGIVGRDDAPKLALPSPKDTSPPTPSKKRKRRTSSNAILPAATEVEAEQEPLDAESDAALQSRLESLSNFQLKLLLHAMAFPSAQRITYSTCSIHPQENEFVVLKALISDIAQERGWRILTRHEQVEGMLKWSVRGDMVACMAFRKEYQKSKAMVENQSPLVLSNYTLGHVAEACIRCGKGTKEGTMGFFVAAFVRDVEPNQAEAGAEDEILDTPMTDVDEDEWQGFSD